MNEPKPDRGPGRATDATDGSEDLSPREQESPESPERRQFLRDAIPMVLGAAAGGIAAAPSEPDTNEPPPSPPPEADEEPPQEMKRELDARAYEFLRDNPGFDPFGSS
jgi:hypothetical protein